MKEPEQGLPRIDLNCSCVCMKPDIIQTESNCSMSKPQSEDTGPNWTKFQPVAEVQFKTFSENNQN